jgi:hypothetical protein
MTFAQGLVTCAQLFFVSMFCYLWEEYCIILKHHKVYQHQMSSPPRRRPVGNRDWHNDYERYNKLKIVILLILQHVCIIPTRHKEWIS